MILIERWRKLCWKKFWLAFSKKIETLLKIIERVYTKNPGMQKLIDQSMIDVCKEEGVSPEQVFFVFAFLCCWLYRNGLGLTINYLCAKVESFWKCLGLCLVVVINKKICRILQVFIFWHLNFKGGTQGSPDLSRILRVKSQNWILLCFKYAFNFLF